MRTARRHPPRLITACAAAMCLSSACAGAGTLRMLEAAQRDSGVTRTLGVSRADVAVIDARVTPGAPVSLRVPINGGAATLVLAPVSQRAPGFRVRVQRADGTWHDADPGPVRTYEGVCPEIPGARAAAFLRDGQVSARIEVPGLPGAFWVEPAPLGTVEVDRAAGNVGIAHVGYHSLDRLLAEDGRGGGAVCDAPAFDPSDRRTGPPDERSACTASVCVAELACDSDFEFFERYGSVEAVQAQIERVIAVMNLQFVGEVGIRHRITTILVRTAPGLPYTAVQSQPLLFQFQAHWKNENGAIPRDVAKLFTGKVLSASVLGSAFIGSICDTSTAYAVVRSDCCGSLAGSTDLSAHELGHVWGAHHCFCAAPNPDSTMNAAITFANTFVTDISGASVASISAGRAGAACLDADTPVPPPGPFVLSTPPTETWGLSGPVNLTWTASANAAFYLVTVADNAGFNSPTLAQATLSPALTVPAAALAPATRYHWKVEAWNDASSVTASGSGAWTFLTAVPPQPCPGNFFPDSAVNTIDLTLLLGKFGQTVPPGQNGDMTGDGRVNTLDLTAFLGRFGSPCP